MNLIEFYKKAVHSVGLDLDSDNFLCVKNAEDKLERIMYSKKQIFLPTDENLKNINDNIIIFNPLEEDSIRGINPAMIKYKSIIDRRLSQTFNTIAELIAILAADVSMQKKASLELNKFISELNKLRKQNMKEIVDETYINLQRKIFNASLTKSANAGSIFIKTDKAKLIDGEKYNKIATLDLPIYDELKENKNTVYDIELKRGKDAGILFTITEFIIGKKDDDIIDTDKYIVGSNNLESPSFIVVYRMYYKLAKRFNALLKSLSFINKELTEKATLNLTLEPDDLAEINSFIGELKMIPNLNAGTKNNIERPSVAGVAANSNVRPIGSVVRREIASQPIGTAGISSAAALLRKGNNQSVEYARPVTAAFARPRQLMERAAEPEQYFRRPGIARPVPVQQEVYRRPMPSRAVYASREYEPFSRHGGFI